MDGKENKSMVVLFEDRLEGVGSGEGLGFVHGRGLREMEFRDGLEFIILALRLTGI
jgi:hypothetical protein